MWESSSHGWNSLPCFQHHYFGAAFAEFLGHDAAGGAGADDTDIEVFVFAQPFSFQQKEGYGDRMAIANDCRFGILLIAPANHGRPSELSQPGCIPRHRNLHNPTHKSAVFREAFYARQ